MDEYRVRKYRCLVSKANRSEGAWLLQDNVGQKIGYCALAEAL